MTLTPSQSKILCELHSMATNSVAEVSVRDLAARTGLSRGGVGKALQALEDGNLIARRSSRSRASGSRIELRETVHLNRPQPSTLAEKPSTRTVHNRPPKPSTIVHSHASRGNQDLTSFPSLVKELNQEERLDRYQVDGSIGDLFERIAAAYPRPENVEFARNLFAKALKRPDGAEIAASMLTAAQIASRLPVTYVKFSLNGKGLDWFVRQGWRDGWAQLLEVESADPQSASGSSPQPVRAHRECDECHEGWRYDDDGAVSRCRRCGPSKAARLQSKPPRRSDELTAVADLAKVVEIDR